MAPPAMLHMPGYSYSITQTSNGAIIVSRSISSDASGEVMYRGPMARKHVPTAIKKPCIKYKSAFLSNPINGSVKKNKIMAEPKYATGKAGKIEILFSFLISVNAAAYETQT